jgi:hypothetical protein
VGDIGLLVEILTRNSSVKVADDKIIEAAGPRSVWPEGLRETSRPYAEGLGDPVSDLP